MTYLLVSGLLSPMPLESSCRGVFSHFERDSEDTIPYSPIPYMYPTDSALQLRVPSVIVATYLLILFLITTLSSQHNGFQLQCT